MKEIKVTFISEEDQNLLTQEEINAYIQRGQEKYGPKLKGITLKVANEDPSYVDIYYDIGVQPFHRLRRITGQPTK